MLTHGTYYNMMTGNVGEGRVATHREHLFMHGMPVINIPGNRFRCPFTHLIDDGSISAPKTKVMSGNAMHAPSVGTLMYYLLSTTKKLPTLAIMSSLHTSVYEEDTASEPSALASDDGE